MLKRKKTLIPGQTISYPEQEDLAYLKYTDGGPTQRRRERSKRSS